MFENLRRWAYRVKQDAVMLWFAYQHPLTPWLPKWLAALAVAYALSPIDLIPDFVPLLGYLDDLLLVPGLVWLAVRHLPDAIKHECHQKALTWMAQHGAKPVSRWGIAGVLCLWLCGAFFVWRWLT